MEYQALYRKYRPTRFSDVIGQEHITTVLKNQVAAGHTSHAYLFSGTRGTGKTTTARILARAVNCTNPIDGEPCMECEACKSSGEGNVDIIEFDAASNNHVEDMRALIEKAVFSPVSLKKKVYIIDEAHMITSNAFNALLKTLEEPPAHVLFILATTEPQKIIPTISSRCQRFDFRRIRVADIVGYLKSVLTQAGAKADEEGLITIATKANGGMRDALSLLDQCMSFCGNKISAADVRHILGSMDTDLMFRLADMLINSDARSALILFEKICSGKDVPVILGELSEHFRALLFGNICGECADVLDCTPDYMKRVTKQAGGASKERIMRAVDILTNAISQLRFAFQPRVVAETALVRICYPESQASLEAAIDRINVLEQQVKNGIKVIEKTPPVAQNTETSAPKKKKLPITADGKALYDALCDAVANSGNLLAEYICGSLARCIGVELDDGLLKASFTDRTFYDTAMDKRELLQNLLDTIRDDIKFTPVLVSGDEYQDDETIVMNNFGDENVQSEDD